MKNAFIIIISIICSSSVKAQKSVTRIWYIGDTKIACTVDSNIMACLKVREHPDSLWRDFPYVIEGFIFEQGVETLIELIETEILFPEDKGPRYTYRLVKVLESKSTLLRDKRILADNKWKIINIERDRKVMPATKRANAWLVFDIDSNKIRGFSGCNSIGGNTFVQDGELGFGVLSSTMMSCENDEIERSVKEALIGRAVFYVRNNMLFIVCENNTILHLRPEKRLDSILAVINTPVYPLKGNAYMFIKDGFYSVLLDEEPEANKQRMMFKQKALTAEEKKTIKLKIVNILPDDMIKEIRILKKPHKMLGMSYAIVIFKDGTKRSIVIKNVR